MQRYMRGMSNGGRVTGEALDNDKLFRACPSIFATEAHDSRSARFAPVPTITIVEGLRSEGFEVFSAQQALTRQEGRAGFTKHMLRLRHRSLARDGEAFEVILVNANDGSSAYQMLPGFFRFVCANGLFTGDTFNEVKVRHSGDAMGEVIEGAFTVLEEAPRVCQQVEAMKAIALSPEESVIFAKAAHVMRFPNATEQAPAPIPAVQLLAPRRHEDAGSALWSTFNRVQENVIRGGQHGRTINAIGQRRRTTVREVNGIDQTRALNRAMWTLAEEMARLKGQPIAA
jgi:hypothetical protein